MLILPDRHIPRARLLMPVPAAEWRTPSQAQPKDQFGRENRTRFRARAILNDGHVAWCGWFDDREDFDRFLWAIAIGELPRDSYVQRLPTPWWPGLDPEMGYEFSTITFLVSPTGSNQTYTSPSDWDNTNNTIECVGAGASGAYGHGAGTHCTGGGAGAFGSISNFVFATPGTTTATYQVGTGGTAVSATTGLATGNDGGATWFNSSADPGAGTDNSVCSAKNGIKGGAGAGSRSGGLGGVGTSGWGQTRRNGGAGGNLTGASGDGSSGGGGAAGRTSVGSSGSGTASTSEVHTNGGGGDASGGGSGGVGGTNGGNGNNGIDFDASHGTGGGGGGGSNVSGSVAVTGGDAGNYGAGGGAANATTAFLATSGVGKQGIVVVTYAPIVVPPYGWQRGTEDFVKSRTVFIESNPSSALTPDTLPPKISGMGWRQPHPDHKRPSWFKNDPAAFGQVITVAPVPQGWLVRPDEIPVKQKVFESPPVFSSISQSLLILGWQPQQVDQAPIKVLYIDRPVFVPQPVVQLEPPNPPGSGKRKDFPSYAPQPAYDVKKRPPIQPVWDRRRRQSAQDELDRERAAARLPVPMPPASIFATPQQVSYPQPTQFAPHQVQRIAQQSGDARDISDIQGIADMQSRDASDMQDVSDIMQLIKGIE